MQTIRGKALSIATAASVNVRRFLDHFWRFITGMPMVGQSMVTPQLFLGGQYSEAASLRFRDLGITAIVNVRMHSIHSARQAQQLNVLQIPTPDKHAPTPKQLDKAVAFIESQISSGGTVYIHCRSGEGRGPTVAIAYLVSTGMTLEAAYALIKNVRSFISPTKIQMRALRQFEKKIQLERGY
jgi:protein-tyrosine phosphatase